MNIANIANSEETLKAELDNFLKKTAYFFNKDTIEEIAKETKFIKRERKLTGHLFLCIFVFGVSIYGNPTIEQLIGLITMYLKDFSISRPGLHLRINEEAVNFFEQILSLSIQLAIPEKLKLSIPNQFSRILIVDSTGIELPEELAEFFRGHGGSASTAGIKIQFYYDLKVSKWFYLIKSAVSPDTSMGSDIVNEAKVGDMILQDLGYFNVETFNNLNQKGAYYLSRLKTDVTFYIKNEFEELIPLDLVNFAKYLAYKGIEQTELSGFVRSKHNTFTPVRLVVEKLPDAVVNQRLRRLNKEAQHKHRQVSYRSRILASVNLYITNAPVELLPAQYCRKLYSIRWQIELIFKAWKSHFLLNKLRGQSIERIKVTLFAKLIFITLASKIVQLTTSLLWFSNRREVSYFRAIGYLQIIAEKWFENLLSHSTTSVFGLLKHAVYFIKEHCFKIPQMDRVYPLEFLENFSFYVLT